MNPSVVDASMARAAIDAALASRDAARTDTFLVGLCLLGLFAVGVALLGQTHSSVDANYSVHVGAIPQTAQTRSPVVPVIAQVAPASSSSSAPGWGS